MNLLDLMVKIGVDDQATKKTKDISNDLTGKLSNAAKVAAKAFAALSAAIGAFGLGAVKVGMDFDASMAQVAATMGKTVDQIGELRDFALKMGSTTAFSASQAADALNYMALAGYNAEQSMQALPNVLNLAAAGNIDLARASDMVTDAQSALGLKFEELEGFVDKLAKTSSTTNTSVEQLGDAILTVGGTAKLMKGGVAELSQVLGLLADNGIKGSEGGTALRNILLALASPTDQAAKQIQELGVQVFDAEGNMRSLKDIMMDFNSALSEMTAEERTNAIANIFNARDLKSVNALLATTEERWDQVADSIAHAQGAAEAMANTQLDNLAGDITLLKSAFEGLQITISDELTPAFREYVQFAGEAIQDLTTAFREGGLEGLTDKFTEILQKGLEMIANSTPQFLDAAIKLIGAMVQGLIYATPQLITALSQALIQVVNNIANNTDAILEAAIEMFLAIQEAVVESAPQILGSLLDLIMSLVESIISHAPELLAAAIQFILNAAVGIASAAGEVLAAMGRLLWDLIRAPGQFIAEMYQAGVDLIGGLVRGIAGSIGRVLDTILGGLRNAVQGALEFLGIASPSKLFRYIGDMTMQGMAEGIEDSADKALSAMENAVDKVSSAAVVDATVGLNAESGMLSNGYGATYNIDRVIVQADSESTIDSLMRDIERAAVMSGRAYGRA